MAILYLGLVLLGRFADESQTFQPSPLGYVILGLVSSAAAGVILLSLRRHRYQGVRALIVGTLRLVGTFAIPIGLAVLAAELR